MNIPAQIPNTADLDVPAVLLPYQQEWLAEQGPLVVIEKSRRTGLTWAEAADDVLLSASAKDAGGMNTYYIAYNQDMTIEYIQACAMWARMFNHAASEIEEGIWEDGDKHIKTFGITFPGSGHRIVALTSRPSNLRGRQGRVVLDEAAFHDQLDEVLKAALALLIWGGQLRVISTHNGVKNPFNTLIQDIRAGKRKGLVQRITFREAVAQGLYRRVCMRLGKEWSQDAEDAWMAGVYAVYGDGAAEELDCIPAESAGAALSRALVESRMVEAPVVRLKMADEFTHWDERLREAGIRDWCERELLPLLKLLDPQQLHAFGEDFGRTGDLTVIAPYSVGLDLRCRVPFLVELRNMPYRQQEQVLFYIVDRLPRLMGGAMDATGNGGYLAEAAGHRYGGCIQQVKLSDRWYMDNMPAFKAAFEDALLEIPRDALVLDDLRALQMIDGILKLGKSRTQGEGGQRHGDAAIALALGYAATRLEVESYGYEPVRPDRNNKPGFDDDNAGPVNTWAAGGVL
ncbi:MAG: hypothetical protein C0439_10300 [Pseudomonas sp.]|nr:hypothetical protein [Pseudomonas sp.]